MSMKFLESLWSSYFLFVSEHTVDGRGGGLVHALYNIQEYPLSKSILSITTKWQTYPHMCILNPGALQKIQATVRLHS